MIFRPLHHFLTRRLPWLAALGLLAVGGVSGHWLSSREAVKKARNLETMKPDLPRLEATNQYVSSQRCQSCHPHEHASWHRTFHRTMTQVALPENVVGAFSNVTVMSDGLAYRVFREGDEFWAEMPDPDMMMLVVQGGRKMELKDVPRVRQRVVMTTGSHHYQTYWVASPRYDRLLQTLPLVYLIGDQRWIPREAAFMSPPDSPGRMITQWNHHCIRCHSTAGNPGLDEKTGRLDSSVAELGISCESCHGPGEEHVRRNQNVARRYQNHLDGKADPTIVNPARLDHRRSSQVCGQCHGVYIFRDEFAMRSASEGGLYKPGEDLEHARYYIQHPARAPSAERWEDLRKNPEFFRERWWDDGTILAGGREYTAMAVSGCYTRGQMSCLSCHSMHDSDPVDQLKPRMEGNAACTQCHTGEKYTRDLTSHTFHNAKSPGSDCMNCHMPHTTYALLGAIRSHEIASPDVRGSIQHGTPNACNLCHLDRTLAWTQEHLVARYGRRPLPMNQEQKTTSAALLWLLKGNAAQRAITAWHVGWAPAQQASGADWLAPFQARLLADPYGVVRLVAEKNLQRLPGFADFRHDFLAPEVERQRDRDRAIEHWNTRKKLPGRTGAEILIDTNGNVMHARVEALLQQRDNRPVVIQE